MSKLKEMTGTEGWKNWQIALAIGVPVVTIVGGVVLYKRYNDRKIKGGKGTKFSKTPKSEAQSLKIQGNEHFKAGRYASAIEYYNKAIECIDQNNKEELATFYQNRAAAQEFMKNYVQVIRDCTLALQLNPRYIKALLRRGRAYKQTGFLNEALEDFTAVCILENFSNTENMMQTDSIIKLLSDRKASEKLKEKTPMDPSPTNVKNLLLTFQQDPLFNNNTDNTSDNINLIEDGENYINNNDLTHILDFNDAIFARSSLKRALTAFENEDFLNSFELCNEEINSNANIESDFEETNASTFKTNEESSDDYERIIDHINNVEESNKKHTLNKLLATSLRGTLNLLAGRLEEAKKDFEEVVNNKDVPVKLKSNCLIKKGKVNLQMHKKPEALADLDMAVLLDPENPDTFFHRAQFYLASENLEKAVNDFKSSTSLSPNYPTSQFQYILTKMRQHFMIPNRSSALEELENLRAMVKKYEKSPEAYAILGQGHFDLQQFEEADECFEKAAQMEPNNPSPYVYRGILLLAWKENIPEAMKLFEKGISKDNKCSFAYQALGTLFFQKGDLEKTVENIKKAIEYSFNCTEVSHLYTILMAADVQKKMTSVLGVQPLTKKN